MQQYSHEYKPKAAYVGPPAELPPRLQRLGVDMQAYLFTRNLSMEVAVDNGWYPTLWDTPRIVMPCTNNAGTVYFQARRMDDSPDLRYRSPRNPAGESLMVCWPLSEIALRAVVVEGPMDALAAATHGFVGVALMGNQPPPERIEYLVSWLGTSYAPFIIVPDADNQQFGAQLSAALAMRGVTSKVVMPVDAKDLCEMPPKERIKLLLGATKEVSSERIKRSYTKARTKVVAAKPVGHKGRQARSRASIKKI